jgi:glycosyltransferase involved in cell wall biosynthesis
LGADIDAADAETVPRVSVVLPVRNEERYIEAAIQSILRQTFADLECIVVDDESTDDTGRILSRIAAQDGRVRIVGAEGSGLVAALNIGVKHARGAYVARMDADDISLPERFARQVQELDARPALGVLGTRVRYIDVEGRQVGAWDVPVGTPLVHWALAFGTPIAHPSVMLRRAVLPEAPYETTSPHAEDYDLWVRLSKRTMLDNLPERLLERRVHGRSISDRNLTAQEASTLRVQQRAIASVLGHEPTTRQVAVLAGPRSLTELFAAVLLIARLYRASGRGSAVRRDAWRRVVGAVKILLRPQ